jgi:hypothetical protein
MKMHRNLLVFFFLLMLANPTYTNAIEIQSVKDEISASEEVEAKDIAAKATKAEKKKDKDMVTINSRFFVTLGIDIAMILLIITLIYYPNYRKMDTIFTFIVFNIMIFLLTFVLNKVKISMGAAFGLFAVFSMLRYRTEGIGMKDMTYLFIFIAVGLIGGIQLEYYVLAIICTIVFIITFVLDSNIIMKRELSQAIQFEKIEMVKPEMHEQLIQELQNRTGLKIHRIAIRKLDYLKDMASIRIYYYE